MDYRGKANGLSGESQWIIGGNDTPQTALNKGFDLSNNY